MSNSDTHPLVWLLGDSIRMSYQERVAEILAGRANIRGPAENGQHTRHTLASLDRWLEELGPPQIIHWNVGLHDCGHNPKRSPRQLPLEEYRGNLGQCIDRLRRFSTRIVWATSTPMAPTRPFSEDQWSWRNDDILKYNEAAGGLMRAHGISLHDLHALVEAHSELYLCEDGIHLSEAGVEACAGQVAEAIRGSLH
jgi:lysophospholipase L1-like esterase